MEIRNLSYRDHSEEEEIDEIEQEAILELYRSALDI